MRRAAAASPAKPNRVFKTIMIVSFALTVIVGFLLFSNHISRFLHPAMNPVIVGWWQNIGFGAQVTIIVAVVGAAAGLFKVLIDKYPKPGFVLLAAVIIGIVAFLFWPGVTTTHHSPEEEMLYGEWKAKFKMLGRYPWECTTVYKPNGKFMHNGLVNLPNGEDQQLVVKGSWFVKDRFVYESIESAEFGLNSMPVPSETKLEMRIIDLNVQNFTYEDLTFHDGTHTMVKINH
jgi:hypothetical protein